MHRRYELEEYIPIHLYSKEYRERLLWKYDEGIIDFPYPPGGKKRKGNKGGSQPYRKMADSFLADKGEKICNKGSKEVREIVVNLLKERDGIICGICGKELIFGNEEIDHILPICLGGTHAAENLRLTHKECNRKRNEELPGFFLGKLKNLLRK